MAKTTKQQREKSPVQLRFKKLKSGATSLYLDIYCNGVRSYEFLKMYLLPAKTRQQRQQNEEVLAAAQAIKAQRVIEIANNRAGIAGTRAKRRITLHDWGQIYLKRKGQTATASTAANVRTALNLLEAYGDNVPVSGINKAYCLGFIKFMRTTPSKRTGRLYTEGTQAQQLAQFRAIMNAAQREGIIRDNPLDLLEANDKPRHPASVREFLTRDELEQLTECTTPPEWEPMKRAFLFCCYCGLRLSDVSSLQWTDLQRIDGRTYAIIKMQKTSQPLSIPLSRAALSCLPEQQPGAQGVVFKDLPSRPAIQNQLKQWAQLAGIAKKVTFHVSRHTFATLSLTLGVDLYTVSKLLGHTDISTTQIYAKIVDEKKTAAADLLDAALNTTTGNNDQNEAHHEAPGEPSSSR